MVSFSRENELTAREGSRRASASHGTRTRSDLRFINRDRRTVSPGPDTRQKERRKKIAPLTSCAFLRAAPQVRLHIADADKLEEGRGDARFVLAVRARCHK